MKGAPSRSGLLQLCLLLCLALGASAEPWSRSFQGFVQARSRGWQRLRSPEEYAQFVQGIPKQRLQQKQPAPPSTDPLLNLPEVDFSSHFLLAVWSENVHIDAHIVALRSQGGEMHLEVQYLRPTQVEGYAAPYGFGQYHLVEVPRFDGELRVQVKEVVEVP